MKNAPPKIEYDSLVLEVTRRCNMNCAHCIRGETENIDMQHEVLLQSGMPFRFARSAIYVSLASIS